MLRTPVAEALGAASAASEIRIGGWVRPPPPPNRV